MRLELNRPFAAAAPALDIDGDLPPGPHRFRLQVVSSSGLRSRPAEVVITIADESAPGEAPRPEARR